MALYAIGDVQGCALTLEALWRALPLAPTDRVVLVGDLVNRGPSSLEVLRFAKSEPRIEVVLGNHDLHLLARARGLRKKKSRDTLDPVLAAPDAEGLLGWLRTRPLLLERDGCTFVHAGLLPGWSLSEARRRAREVEGWLGDPGRAEALLAGYAAARGPVPEDPSDPLARAVFGLQVFTLLRTCTPDGRPRFDYDGPPALAPAGLRPWFELGRWDETTLVFGHWAALGLHVGERVIGLDSGCVWGRTLTAVRLGAGAERAFVSVPTIDAVDRDGEETAG